MSRLPNPDKAISAIKQFLTDKLQETGLAGYVVGLSGGIDSALSASLAVRAVGATRVFAILMPYRTSAENSLTDAVTLADKLGIDRQTVDISPMIDAYYQKIEPSMRLRAGNKMARERMSILFDVAHDMNRLVLGTGNRTETCLGYTTLYGDSACSVNPIGELYKTEVRQLAEVVGVPREIINKTPSADLWADQTDEDEIGVKYEEIDRILMKVVDEGETSRTRLESEGLNLDSVLRVISLLNHNAFKRSMPPMASLGRVVIPDHLQLED